MKRILTLLLSLFCAFASVAQGLNPPPFNVLKKYALLSPQVTSADRAMIARGRVAVNPGLAADSIKSDSIDAYSSTTVQAALAEVAAYKAWLNNNLAGAQVPTFVPATDSTRARYHISPGVTTMPAVLHNCDLNFTGSGDYYLVAPNGITADSTRTFSDVNMRLGSVVWTVSGEFKISNAGLVGIVLSDSIKVQDNVGGAFTLVPSTKIKISGTDESDVSYFTPHWGTSLVSVENIDPSAALNIANFNLGCNQYTIGITGNLVRNGNFENLTTFPFGRINNLNSVDLPACNWETFDVSNTPDIYHTQAFKFPYNGGTPNCNINVNYVNLPYNPYLLTSAIVRNISSYNESVAGIARIAFVEDRRESICQRIGSPMPAGKYLIGYSTSGSASLAGCSPNSSIRYVNFRNFNLPISLVLTEGKPTFGNNSLTWHTNVNNFVGGVMRSNNGLLMDPIAPMNYATNQTIDQNWIQVSALHNLNSNISNPYLSFGLFERDPVDIRSPLSAAYSLADVYVVRIPELSTTQLSPCGYNFQVIGNELPQSANPNYQWSSTPAGLFTTASSITPSYQSGASSGQYTVTLTVTFNTRTGRIINGVPEEVIQTVVSSALYTHMPEEIVVCAQQFPSSSSSVFAITGASQCFDGSVSPTARIQLVNGLKHVVPLNPNIITRTILSGTYCSGDEFCKKVVIYPQLQVLPSIPNGGLYNGCLQQDLIFIVGQNIILQPTERVDIWVTIYRIDIGNPNQRISTLLPKTLLNGPGSIFSIGSSLPGLLGPFEVVFGIGNIPLNLNLDCEFSFKYNTSINLNYSMIPEPTALVVKEDLACRGPGQITVNVHNTNFQVDHNHGSVNGFSVQMLARFADGTVKTDGDNDPSGSSVSFTLNTNDIGLGNANFVDLTFTATYDGGCTRNITIRHYIKGCCFYEVDNLVKSGWQLLGDVNNPSTPVIVNAENPLYISKNTVVVSPIVVEKSGSLVISGAEVRFLGNPQYAFSVNPALVPGGKDGKYYNTDALKPVGVTGAGIYFSTGSKPIANGVQNISIRNSVLTGMCDDMWPGIGWYNYGCFVGGASYSTYGNLIIRDSEILNAYAVYSDKNSAQCFNGSSTQFNQADLVFESVAADNCYKGLELVSPTVSNTNTSRDIAFRSFVTDLKRPYSLQIATLRAEGIGGTGTVLDYVYRSHSLLHVTKLERNSMSSIDFKNSSVYGTLYGALIGADDVNYANHLNFNYSGISHRLLYVSTVANQNVEFPLNLEGVSVRAFGGDQSDPYDRWHSTEQIQDELADFGLYSSAGYINTPNYYNLPAFMSQGPLSLSNCQVTGSNPDRSIGALAFRGGLSVVGSQFSSLKHGVLTYDRYNTITTNYFEDCREAIYQGGGGPNNPNSLDVTTTLTCNRFTNGSTFSGTKYGLYVEDGVLMNDIGGDGQGAGFGDPNANVFPTAGARPTQDKFSVNNQDGWDVPSDFVALRFPSNSQANYYAYENEFVGAFSPIGLVEPAAKECYTSANPPSNPTANQTEVCPSLGSSDIYFPLRVGALTNLNQGTPNHKQVYPNPCTDVLYFEGQASKLVVTNVLGAEQAVSMVPDGNKVTLNVKELPAGIYYLKTETGTTKFIKQ